MMLLKVYEGSAKDLISLIIFWLIRSFADPSYAFSNIIVRGPLHTLLLFFIYFGTVGLHRSDMLCFL